MTWVLGLTMREYELKFNVTEEELRAWMDAEIVRLGGSFNGFDITWHRDERIHWLELWSNATADHRAANAPFGKCIRIGVVPTDESWVAVPILQQEGRKLYHKLRKDYPVKRDLGRY